MGIGTAISRNRLVVPVNQRDYAWEQKHVNDLFQDLLKAIDANKPAYFLGVLTTTAKGDALEVADGQQRLATTTILLAAIRDYFIERNDDLLVNSIENEFLFKIVRETKLTVPKLTLNANDHEYFARTVLDRPNAPGRQGKNRVKPTKESHRLIEQAAKMAADHIRSLLGADTTERGITDKLNRWVHYIEHSALVIMLRVPDNLSAFVMFETLNDRGRKTSQADLLKNFIFEEAGDRVAEAQQKWSAMAGIMESLEADDVLMTYLRHLTISRYGHTIARDVYETLQNHTTGKGKALEFLTALEADANIYAAILTPTHSYWNDHRPEIRQSVSTMVELRVVPIRPLMLSVARKFDHTETVKAFKLFIRWSVRFLIAGGNRSGSLEQAYAGRALSVSRGEITTAKELAAAMRGVVPTDSEFEAAFAVARVSQQYLARYYLRSLELRKKNQADPEWIPNEAIVINLEHVLPENPGNNWPDVDADTAAAHYRRIGNFALLQAKRNTFIGNSPFSQKRPVLAESTFELTKEIGREQTWGLEQINNRQQRLAKLAVETWPLTLT